MRNGDANNHIVVHHQLTDYNSDWDSAQCLTYSTNYFRLTLESCYSNLEQTPLNVTIPPSKLRAECKVTATNKQTTIWRNFGGHNPVAGLTRLMTGAQNQKPHLSPR